MNGGYAGVVLSQIDKSMDYFWLGHCWRACIAFLWVVEGQNWWPYQQPWQIQSHWDLQTAHVSSEKEMRWEFGVFSWFPPLSHCRQLCKCSLYKDGCTEPAWWSHHAVSPECFPSCQQTYLSTLCTFLFKLFWQSSSMSFHFEVQLAFPVVGMQSSTTHWGKASPFVHFTFVTCFHVILSGSSGEGDSEQLLLSHLLHPLMPEQASLRLLPPVSKALFAIPLLIPHVPWPGVRGMWWGMAGGRVLGSAISSITYARDVVTLVCLSWLPSRRRGLVLVWRPGRQKDGVWPCRGKTIKTSMFIKKKATSSAFQALITQHNFAVGSSGIKQVFLMLISLNLRHIIKTKSIKNEGSVCTNIVKNSYLSFFKNKL